MEGVAEGLQFPSEFNVIVQLTVKNDRQVIQMHRLIGAGVEVNDRETAVDQAVMLV